MKKYKFAKGLFAAVLLATSMISCSEDVMDGINVDRNHATDVQAKFIVTDLITSTAFTAILCAKSATVMVSGSFWRRSLV